MNISKIFMLDEINLVFGKRNLSYFPTGYSYWYNGREISNKTYSESKWKKIKEKFNKGFGCTIERNPEYSFQVAWEADDQIANAVKNDINSKRKVIY